MRAIIALAVLACAAQAHAQGHTCRPVTIGQSVLDRISSDFNLGFDNEDPDADVRGFQLHIDRDNNAIPDTSFIKWPDPWPVPGADPRNRTRIGPSSFVIAGDDSMNLTMSVNDLNATRMEVDFSCHPDEFAKALKDGAIRGELEMQAMGREPEIQLEFRWRIRFTIPEILDFDAWITVDLVDIDLPNETPLKIIVALVPEVTPDGKSVKLRPFVDVDDVASTLVFEQLADELAQLELTIAPILADLICLPTGLGSVCSAVAHPIVRVVVGLAVETLRVVGIEKFKQALEGYVKCFLEPFNRTPGTAPAACSIWSPPAPGENRFVEQLGNRLRGQLARLELPKRIRELPIPNYSAVSKYEPMLVTSLCP